MSKNVFRDALLQMAIQFGYRGTKGGKPVIHTGGLSALEDAFEALGWADPHYLLEEGYTCEIVGCVEEDTCGKMWGDLYLRLCSRHYKDSVEAKDRPPVKDYALRREARRDPITHVLRGE